MKYAVADISSSSLSVTIAERKGSVTEIVGKERESLSLLYYMDGRDLSRRGREKLIGALTQMKARLTEMGVGKCWLIATAALRHIGNFDEVADAVRSATGLVMNLIDGESEAYFDYVANECYSTCERAVLVDLGGKSMEVCALGGEKTMTCCGTDMRVRIRHLCGIHGCGAGRGRKDHGAQKTLQARQASCERSRQVAPYPQVSA